MIPRFTIQETTLTHCRVQVDTLHPDASIVNNPTPTFYLNILGILKRFTLLGKKVCFAALVFTMSSFESTIFITWLILYSF
jgi:hypothetical protein